MEWAVVRGPLVRDPHARGRGPRAAAGRGRGQARRAGRCHATARAGSAWASPNRYRVLPQPAAETPLAPGSAAAGYLVAGAGHRLGHLKVGFPPWPQNKD